MESLDEKLIELVRNYPVLYDTNDINYMKTKFKQEIWTIIATELNLSNGEEAKSSWVKLRNNHRDALRRQKRLIKSGAPATELKTWKFQSKMEFLLKYMIHENRECNFNADEENSQLPQEDNCQILETEQNCLFNEEEYILVNATVNKPDEYPKKTKIPKRKETKVQIDSLIAKAIEQRDQMSKERIEERKWLEERITPKDGLYLFYMSMYEITKKMPPLSQHLVRKNVFSSVSQEEARLLNIPETTYSPTLKNM